MSLVADQQATTPGKLPGIRIAVLVLRILNPIQDLFGDLIARLVPAVIPEKRDRRQTFTCRKLKSNLGLLGKTLTVEFRGLGLNAGGITKLQRPERHIRSVACHITERARSVINPTPPF